MATFKRPEPSPVSGPSSAIPIVKIHGNMIELNRPTDKIVHIATCPFVRTEVVTSKPAIIARSEEHTSELQSHLNLVCRLLLEKKKRSQVFTDLRLGQQPDTCPVSCLVCRERHSIE